MRSTVASLLALCVIAVGSCNCDPAADGEGEGEGEGEGAEGEGEGEGEGAEGEGEGEGEPGPCGDGILNQGERCDSGTVVDPGCVSCLVVDGFACIGAPSVCHEVVCGDAIAEGNEGCDVGDALDAGCVACEVVDGFACTGSPSACHPTVCGDDIAEGNESCDDGNIEVGDGCANCQLEPVCTAGVCDPVCGDGNVFAGEECDDGNRVDGDGCSSSCTQEDGFLCTLIEDAPPDAQVIPIVYRDHRGRDLVGGHCDFQRRAGTAAGIDCGDATELGSERGIVSSTWDAVTKKPVYALANGHTTSTSSRAYFNTWYNDDPAYNVTIADTLTLQRQGNGTYVFENTSFFPLDGRGNIANGTEQPRDNGHNFHFTSELRFWFTYTGEPITLEFFGDDDVWVFINTHLAVDIGGIHGPETGDITIDASNEADFGLEAGGVYEAAVFQAERQTVGSQYKLTLAGFFPPRSQCVGDCGDGDVVGDEVCDDGTANNDGRYDGCTATCTRGPFCGDGVTDAGHEVCDDGANNGQAGRCGRTCQGQTGVCGNGVLDEGEGCDDGVNDGAYNGCLADCSARAGFCGDSVVNEPQEQCDDGNDANNDTCTTTCTIIIGG
jgi:fibro-slime domain-containing protein